MLDLSARTVADAHIACEDRCISWAQSMRIRLKAGSIILLFVLALAACSEAVVTPNRTNPAFIGTYGPGGSGWH
jgi:hypothetical protein